MMVEPEKIRYFATSLAKAFLRKGLTCPSCGGNGKVVSRKYLVSTLRRCGNCSLLYRAPISGEQSTRKYYQKKYQSGFTTDLPDNETLAGYLNSSFAGTPKDFGRYIRVLEALAVARGSRVLDLGCSWGYGVWQFRRAGFDAAGHELGEDRAAFARNTLGVPVVAALDDMQPDTFDVVFSSHVLEHIAQLGEMLEKIRKILRPGGLFVAVTPNGSEDFRRRSPAQWNQLWGLKHPLFLDGDFWRTMFAGMPYLLTTEIEDLELLERWSSHPRPTVSVLSGWELMAIFRNEA